MSEEQLKAFLEKVKADTSLQEKLKAARSPGEVVGIAKEQGYEFTAEQLTKFGELSEEELEGVAGGVRGYRQIDIANDPNYKHVPGEPSDIYHYEPQNPTPPFLP